LGEYGNRTRVNRLFANVIPLAERSLDNDPCRSRSAGGAVTPAYPGVLTDRLLPEACQNAILLNKIFNALIFKFFIFSGFKYLNSGAMLILSFKSAIYL